MILCELFLLVCFGFIAVSSANSCDPNPCQAGGKCVVTNTGIGFWCSCKSGYTGKRCERGVYVYIKCIYTLFLVRGGPFDTWGKLWFFLRDQTFFRLPA